MVLLIVIERYAVDQMVRGRWLSWTTGRTGAGQYRHGTTAGRAKTNPLHRLNALRQISPRSSMSKTRNEVRRPCTILPEQA